MFQNVLAFMDKLFHKAREGYREDSSFKDQPDEQRFNPPDRGLIENHRQTLLELRPAGQGHMQGNEDLRRQMDVVQKAIEPLFALFGPGSQRQASGQRSFGEPPVASPGAMKQGDQGIGHQGDIFQDGDPDHPAVKKEKRQKITEQIIVFDPFGIARAMGLFAFQSASIRKVLGAVRERPLSR